MLSERLSKLREHPIVGSFWESLGVIRQGLQEIATPANSSEDENSEQDPEIDGPIDGPAPNKETIRSQIVCFSVEDGNNENEEPSMNDEDTIKEFPLDVEIQFWMPKGGGGIFGAWRVNGQEGQYGVFERAEETFWFGSKPFWTSDGRKRASITLDNDVSEELWSAFSSLLAQFQNRNYGIYSEASDEEIVFEDNPAQSTRSVGDPIDVIIVSETTRIPARFQVWHPESSGAAFVAWQIGGQSGRYGILHAGGLWLGAEEQFESPSGIISPFIYIAEEKVKQKLEDNIKTIQIREGEDSVQTISDVDVRYSSNPQSPGRNHPWEESENS